MGKETIYKITDDRLLLSTAAMQKAFGVSRQTLSVWGELGCPKNERGWWDINEVVEWKIERDVGIVRNEIDMTDKDRKTLYEADLKKAQAEAAEFKNAILRGDYLEKVQVIKEISQFLSEFKRAALGISRKVATEISPYVDAEQARGVEALVNETMRGVLENFSSGNFE